MVARRTAGPLPRLAAAVVAPETVGRSVGARIFTIVTVTFERSLRQLRMRKCFWQIGANRSVASESKEKIRPGLPPNVSVAEKLLITGYGHNEF